MCACDINSRKVLRKTLPNGPSNSVADAPTAPELNSHMMTGSPDDAAEPGYFASNLVSPSTRDVTIASRDARL